MSCKWCKGTPYNQYSYSFQPWPQGHKCKFQQNDYIILRRISGERAVAGLSKLKCRRT